MVRHFVRRARARCGGGEWGEGGAEEETQTRSPPFSPPLSPPYPEQGLTRRVMQRKACASTCVSGTSRERENKVVMGRERKRGREGQFLGGGGESLLDVGGLQSKRGGKGVQALSASMNQQPRPFLLLLCPSDIVDKLIARTRIIRICAHYPSTDRAVIPLSSPSCHPARRARSARLEAETSTSPLPSSSLSSPLSPHRGCMTPTRRTESSANISRARLITFVL